MTDAIPDGHSQHCPRRSARRDVVLWAVLVASFGIKAGLVAATHDSPLVLDETEYVQQARTIAQQGRYVGTFRPPLYSASLAGVLLLGGTLVHVKLAQVLLSTLTVVFVYRMARRTVGLQAARAAAVLCALDPVLITFTHHIWSETVYIFLFAATADLMTSDVTWRHRWPWLIVGALLGLAGLTRPMILSFAPLMVVWTLLQTHRQADPGPAHAESTTTRKWPTGFMRIALLTLGCILIVLPWTLRNARVTGAFVLVDTNGPFNLLVGSQRAAAFVDKDDFWSFRYGQVG
ncbi:MAG: ArnT family glycosyltransferase, partial [Phycisphaerae bacterium]